MAPDERVVPALSAASLGLADQRVALPTAAEGVNPSLAVSLATVSSPATPVLTAPVSEAPTTTVIPPVMVPTPQPAAAAPDVVDSVLVPISGTGPVAPVESAVSWVMLAAARRELGTPAGAQNTAAAAVPTGPLPSTDPVPNQPVTRSAIPAPAAAVSAVQIIDPVASATATNPIAAFFEQIAAFVSQIVTAITQVINQVISAITNIFSPAPANKVPVAAAPPTVGTPDAATGVVTGTVTATDPDGDTVTYSAPASTAKGAVVIDAATGEFVYTPTEAARRAAAGLSATGAEQSDSFTVTVTDGNDGSLQVPVSVAISPLGSPAISVGEADGVWGLVVSPDGRWVYTADYSQNTISVVDTKSYTVARTIEAGPPSCRDKCSGPMFLAISPDGSRVYTIGGSVPFFNPDGSLQYYVSGPTVTAIDTASGAILNQYDTGSDVSAFMAKSLALSPNGQKVYVSSNWSVIDTATDEVSFFNGTGWTDDYPVQAPQFGGYGVTISRDGQSLYYTDVSGALNVVEAATGTKLWGVSLSSPATGIAVNADNSRVYVGVPTGVAVIDVATQSLITTIGGGGASSVQNIALSPDGTRLYVLGSELRTIDTSSNTLIASEKVGNNPYGVAVSPDGSRVYVTNKGDGTLSIVTV